MSRLGLVRWRLSYMVIRAIASIRYRFSPGTLTVALVVLLLLIGPCSAAVMTSIPTGTP